MENTVRILSTNLCAARKEKILKTLEERLSKGEKTKIFTPNTQMLLAAEKDTSLANLLGISDLNLPDGTGLLLASKILGAPLPERMAGIDVAEDILKIAEQRGYSVFLLGGKKGRARRAARVLEERHPRLKICGCHNGYFSKFGEENIRVREMIARSSPDILFVCFGFPLQERWIAENLHYLPTVKLAIGLGGSLDVWSGSIRRAPKIFQQGGIEWLWRTAREPRRIGIIKDIPLFMYKVIKQKNGLRKSEAPSDDFYNKKC